LFLPRKSAGAQRVEIACEQLVRGHLLAEFSLQLVPDAGRRRDRNLLPHDSSQQRAIATRSYPFLRITNPGECLRNAAVSTGQAVKPIA